MQPLGNQVPFVVKPAFLKRSLPNLLSCQSRLGSSGGMMAWVSVVIPAFSAALIGNEVGLSRGLTTGHFADGLVLLSCPERMLLTELTVATGSPLCDAIGRYSHSIGLALRWSRFTQAISPHDPALALP